MLMIMPDPSKPRISFVFLPHWEYPPPSMVYFPCFLGHSCRLESGEIRYTMFYVSW